MRVLLVVTGVVSVITGLVAFAVWKDRATRGKEAAQVARTQAEHTGQESAALGTIQRLSLWRTQARLGSVDEKLAELNGRVQDMEKAATDAAEATDADVPVTEGRQDDPNMLSETVLSEWMDRTMSAGPSNQEWASKAERQLSEGLVGISDIQMNGVDCGERFCRARFIVERENRVDMRDLLSLPVFQNEAFTVLGEEDALDVYFTASGVPINDLKSEAWGELQ